MLYEYDSIKTFKYDLDEVLRAISGREKDIFINVAGIPEIYLDGKGHPCPYCGEGVDRFFYNIKHKYIMCRYCFSGTVIQAVSHFCIISIGEAIELIGEYLGCSVNPNYREQDFTFRNRDHYIKQKKKNNDVQFKKMKVKKKKHLLAQKDYVYKDMDGTPAFKVTRLEEADDCGNKSKRMLQSRFINGEWEWGLNGSTIDYPYNLPDIISEDIQYIFIVEGEKCADALNEILKNSDIKDKSIATTLAGGSGQAKRWSELKYWLYLKTVFILSDNDKPGIKAARIACDELRDVVNEGKIKIVDIANYSAKENDKKEGYDIADWIEEQRSSKIKDKEIANKFCNIIKGEICQEKL